MAQFGEILAELRNDKGLSQEELGQKLHVAGSTISSYERCVNLPNSERILQLAEFFHVTTDYLLGRTSYNLSPDLLMAPFNDHISVHELVELMQNLPEDRRNACYLILSDVHFCASVQKRTETASQTR